ncbi:MAG: hypothetical protein O2854_03810 [Chloroflexi bacterium]|nr:hypothetical protein [Chloroflexota bacterium]
MIIKGYFTIPTAAGGFFLSSWIAMIFWGMLAPDFGLPTVSYVKAMLGTIAIWLTVAPLAAATTKSDGRKSEA